MKFVNLDESEIIEQPLEKVIARPDYSPIEFGYDDLCSLDSVSVDGIHPSGDDSDLILPPSINKINNCFKSEYFKVSNLFSEIQTYEQKQQALKNLGILDAINDSSYIYNLGKFDKTGDAEKEAIKIANNSNIAIILYYVGDQNGVILQQVSDTITKQILLWDNTIFQRHVNFSDSSKTQVSSTSSWWKLGATHISYDSDTRKFHLQDMNYKNLNPTVDSQVPLASSTLDGFMSKELVKRLGTTLVKSDITNNLTTSSSTKVLSAQMGKTLKTEIDNLQSLVIKDLGTGLQPHIATGNIITYVKDNDIKETILFKYIDTDGSSTLGVCISRVNNYGWMIYLINRKGMERLSFNSNGVREAWNEYGGVLRHDLDSVTNEQLECLSVKGLKSVLSTKLDALSPGDGITMMNNTVSTLIGNGLTYNGREIVINHDLTLKTNNGKLGVNAGDGLYVNPDNELGINIGKGLAINHTDSTVEVAEEIFEELDSKAPLEGYAPNLKVRFSDGLVGRIETIPREIGRISPTAGISVDDSSATIERIKGESVVWNQLLSENNFRVASATLEEDGDYYKIIPTHASANRFQQRRNVIKDHVYLQTAIVYNTSNVNIRFTNYLSLTMTGSNSYTNKSVPTLIWDIKKATETIDSYIQIANLSTSDPYWIKKNSFFLYDLTLMFGAGNEPTTIEEFEARKPLGVTNEYNEGTIVSFQGGDVKSVGFNIFDKDKNVEQGSIDTITGNDISSPFTTTLRTPMYIPIVGDHKYNIVYAYHFYEYDENKNFIKHTHISDNTSSIKQITTSKQSRYARIVYNSTMKDTICIHLVHSGYRNGDYEPYVDDIHPLPDIKSIKDNNGDILFPYGLLSAGSAHDEITTTKAIKRIGVVDMGSLNWDIANNGAFRTPLSLLSNIKYMYNDGQRNNQNAMSSKYGQANWINFTVNVDKIIAIGAAALFTIDSSYTTADEFKQAMSGVLLYYELAEPIEVDLPEPLNMTYEAWDFGTEELVVSEPSTSLKGEIIYHFNAVDRIRENSRNIDSISNLLNTIEQTVATNKEVVESNLNSLDESITIKKGSGTNSSLQVNAPGSDASGTNSFAVGMDAIASGDYSVAMGRGCSATGRGSVALGGTIISIKLTGDKEAVRYLSSINSIIAEYLPGFSLVKTSDLTTPVATITASEVIDNVVYITVDKTLSSSSALSNTTFGLIGNKSSGAGSIALGASLLSSNLNSTAEGWATVAAGRYSHTEGAYTIAKGESSHAEGGYTIAEGLQSHAEGAHTLASGSKSHAEGLGTIASGLCSHAEGCGVYNIYLTGNNSIYQITYGGNVLNTFHFIKRCQGASIVEYTNYTKIAVINSIDISEDGYTVTIITDVDLGELSNYKCGVAINIASGQCSHTENGALSSGKESHAGGWSLATNECSFSHGYDCAADGEVSTSFGINNYSQNQGEFTLGISNHSHTGETSAELTLFSIGCGDWEKIDISKRIEQQLPLPTPEDGTNALEVMRNGDIWLGGYEEGVKLFEGETKELNTYTKEELGIELLTNGNLKLTLKGETREFMPATPSGDPMHYAYIAAGAEWNDTEDVIKKTPIWKTEEFWLKEEDGTYTYWEEDVTIDHLPKHWYLNGIGDIANDEMREIYNNGRLYVGNDISNLYNTKARTALPSRKSGGEGTTFDLYYLCGSLSYIETLVLTNNTLAYVSTIHAMFANSRRIVRIFPAIAINTTNTENLRKPFTNAKTLKECELQRIALSVSYADCPLIYKRSILGVINNCNPKSAITITLHPDAYARIVNLPDIIAALETKNTALEGTGGSVSLVSA